MMHVEGSYCARENEKLNCVILVINDINSLTTCNLPTFCRHCRPGHSTETATLRVLSNILEAVDSGDVAALILLDLSAAFDTVDHAILCRRLQVSYGLGGPVLEWFQSYLYGRSQYVRRGTLGTWTKAIRLPSSWDSVAVDWHSSTLPRRQYSWRIG